MEKFDSFKKQQFITNDEKASVNQGAPVGVSQYVLGIDLTAASSFYTSLAESSSSSPMADTDPTIPIQPIEEINVNKRRKIEEDPQ